MKTNYLNGKYSIGYTYEHGNEINYNLHVLIIFEKSDACILKKNLTDRLNATLIIIIIIIKPFTSGVIKIKN